MPVTGLKRPNTGMDDNDDDGDLFRSETGNLPV
jgi:hypothetical protein